MTISTIIICAKPQRSGAIWPQHIPHRSWRYRQVRTPYVAPSLACMTRLSPSLQVPRYQTLGQDSSQGTCCLARSPTSSSLPHSGPRAQCCRCHVSYRFYSLSPLLHLSSTPTCLAGVSAIGIDGVTLHSFAGCGVPTTAKDFGKMFNGEHYTNWRQLKFLIIDEISMVQVRAVGPRRVSQLLASQATGRQSSSTGST
jgi:hypothetical protein